jgi:hypothetical protein
LPRPPEIRLPPRVRWPWLAVAVSVAVHGLLLFGWVGGRRPDVPHRPAELIVLTAPAEGPVAIRMPYHEPRPEGPRGPGLTGRRPSRPALRPRPQPVAAVPPAEPERPVVPVDTVGAPPQPPQPSLGLIGPGLADGRLWVRPLPLPPKELAERLRPGHAQLVDSAVNAIVQAYLDSIASDPGARAQALPSWTKEIAGKKFGIDSKNIYIAGLKIPAAVLALLPIPAGNIDQNRAYNHLMDLRADLQYAAQRSANLDEFKSMIRDMRLRKEREREFERNQRTAPPPADTAHP